MESLKVLSYAQFLRIYRKSFSNYFGYNIESFLSVTEGFNMELFCDVVGFRGAPNQLESYVVGNFGTQALVILRAINAMPSRRVARHRFHIKRSV